MARASSAVRCADVLVIVGTSGVVYPAAGLVDQAEQKGVPFIEINPNKSPFSDRAQLFLPLPAAVALPEIVTAVRAGFSEQQKDF